jgi:hypothetical protein
VRVESVNALREPSRVPPSFSGAPLLIAQLEGEKTTQKQEVSVADEQNVTSALLKLLSPQSQTVYFLSGHGEVEPRQIPECKMRSNTNYTLKTLSLLPNSAKVPADAAALIVMAPQVTGCARSSNSARLCASKRPHGLAPRAQPPKLPRFEALLKSLGAQIGSGSVFDPQQAYRSPELPVGVRGDVTRHPILRRRSGRCRVSWRRSFANRAWRAKHDAAF